MERLQELEILIKAQQDKADEAWRPLSARCKEISNEFNNKIIEIASPITKNVKSTFTLDDWGEGSGSCKIIDDEGKDIFGASFDFYYSQQRYRAKEEKRVFKLEVNIGTCGSFGIDDEAQINKYKVFGAVLDNLKDLENYLNEKGKEVSPLTETYNKEARELERLDDERRAIIEEQKRAESKATVVAGNLYRISGGYKHKDFKGYNYARVKEFQDKRILFEVGGVTKWNPATGNYEEDYLEFKPYDTYLFDKETFFNRVFWNSVDLVKENLKGQASSIG